MYTTPEPDFNFDKYDEERLHLKRLLSASIVELDMPMRIAIPLDNAGIRRLRNLVRLNRKELLKINRLGEKAVNDIENLLARFGLSLDMVVEE